MFFCFERMRGTLSTIKYWLLGTFRTWQVIRTISPNKDVTGRVKAALHMKPGCSSYRCIAVDEGYTVGDS
ncbi:hypothetical protein SAMN04489725_10339 [Alicyclobacillus hesperidum]|uniref:Uncharacterized protein n=1 Tax=Alicyclobacillus hesperidum TaxID=89784 RepID=A0A1H2RLF7_9BACL|nr:hypothetical protein SAMN04489725_10339 [Alicyclobacillus hesperidum]